MSLITEPSEKRRLSRALVADPLSILGLDTMTLRVSADETILYANSAFASFLNMDKDEIIGQSIRILEQLFSSDTLNTLISPASTNDSVRLIRDTLNRSYELKVSFHGTVRDIVIHDVTDLQRFHTYVRRYLPPGQDGMTEEDLSTFKFPERRFMSVSFTDLRGFTGLSETLSPEEIREMINAYLEEVIGAVDNNHASVDKIIGDEVMVLYGAPRYHRDHALRSIKTACEQMQKLRALQLHFQRIGRPMPDCGIGINTGDMVVGNIGTSTRQDYTVLGSSVNMASRLCSVARGGEVLLSETTLNAALQTLPEGWEILETRLEEPVDFKPEGSKAEAVFELPEELQSKVIVIGPNMDGDHSKAEYYFFYLYMLQAKGIEQPFPVLSVVAAKENETTLSLNDQAVLHMRGEKIFGKYRLQEVLGRGGMGEVWKASDTFGNPLAIKMLLAGESASEDQLKRFKQEARILSKLPHRNICRIHEVGEYDGRSYLAMEYVDGLSMDRLLAEPDSSRTASDSSDLSSLIATIRRHSAASVAGVEGEHLRTIPIPSASSGSLVLPVQQTLAIIARVCDAIQYAHQQGVLHRDIKPGNIMIRADGEPVVMDFGLAKLERHVGANSLSAPSLGVNTITGHTVGTIDFMAPEQALSSKDVDERADVYSLGAVLYRMLTGNPHFYTTGHLLNDAQKLQTLDPIPLHIHRPQIDPDLEIITLKALRADPAERYRSAAALRDDLGRYQLGEVIHARPVSLREITGKWIKRNRPLFIAVTGSVVAIFVILALSVVDLNMRRIEAERLRISAEESARAARASENTALEARNSADTAMVQLEREKRENEALLAKYDSERKARGEAELKLTEADKQRLQAEAGQRKAIEERTRVVSVARERLDNGIAARRIRNELELGQWQTAYDTLENARQLNPEVPELWMLKARLHAAAFQLNEALQSLDQLKKNFPGSGSDYEYLEEQLREFHEVTKDLPNAEEDRELQNAFARRLIRSSHPDDRKAGTYLERHSPARTTRP